MDDSALVARLRRGDRAAFEEVFDRHADGVFAMLRRLTGSEAQADDLLQDTFLKLASAARDLDPATRLGPYVFAIARNTWLSSRRARRFDAAVLLEELMSPGPSPYTEAVWGEASARTEAAIARLAGDLRETLAMSLSGLEPQDAARALGLSDDAYRKRLSRARAALRDDLGPVYAEVFS